MSSLVKLEENVEKIKIYSEKPIEGYQNSLSIINFIDDTMI